MIESILDSVKKVLGLDPSYTVFDEDIMMHINATFGELQQLGIGPDEGFEITDNEYKWSDFLPVGDPVYNMAKSFTVLSVRLLFDPPATSFAIEAMQKQIDKLGWRLNVHREFIKYPYTPPVVPEGVTVWTLSVGDPWPSGAVTGDVGFDPVTGDVWRYV